MTRRELLQALRKLMKDAETAGEQDFHFDLDDTFDHYARRWKIDERSL